MNESAPGHYQVLARKYRPASFDDLIGQEPMVRTLRNAFAAGRIPHAWMLTGVRGVGKTTTARILARGLNYQTEDGSGGPTVDLSSQGVHCQSIMEGRHPDVIEMDAASHTGIDDIRDIIDSARYSPVTARYKVYIIDEVHMLSKAAFNGLLKTLEEPPAHVKFIFATTEIRKVPVTVLSRCQRFDLRRIEASRLILHLSSIAAQEKVDADEDALRQIARAAEGSVRDALSILDQAIAHGAGRVGADTVQDMLGLADRARTIDLFEHVMRGDTAAALEELQAQHDTGADPLAVLTDLAEFTHYVTRLKLAPNAAASAAASESERLRGTVLAETLSVRVLARTWQMLLKGMQETGQAARPIAAADMVLVRLCHAADMPTPDEALRMLQDGSGPVPGARPVPAAQPSRSPAPVARQVQAVAQAQPQAQPVRVQQPQAFARPHAVPEPPAPPAFRSFDEIIARARSERDRILVFELERHVRPVKIEAGTVEIALTAEAKPDLPQRLGNAMKEWTGTRWIVVVSQQDAAETAHEARERNKAAVLAEVRADPLIAEVMARFPGTEIVDVRDRPAQVRLDAGSEPEAEPELEAELEGQIQLDAGLGPEAYDPSYDDDDDDD